MTAAVRDAPRPSGSRRGIAAIAAALFAIGAGTAPATPAGAADHRPAASQPLVLLLASHTVRSRPSAHARRIEAVAARRPLTGVRTVLPVLAEAGEGGKVHWVRVGLPGRPNGHTGWISTRRTKRSSTEWHVSIDLSARRVTVYRGGKARRRFAAVVGNASTPTPRGRFFVEEALALSPHESGGPFALATSARSRVYREFEGGPGQIALHGTANLSGALGTAVSHGCVRLSAGAIGWLARRVGRGAPLTIRR